MAPKRALSAVDSLSREGSQASKRARTGDADGNEPEVQHSKPFSKGKRLRATDDDDNEEKEYTVGPTTLDEDEEKRFEEEHEEEIREKLMSKPQTHIRNPLFFRPEIRSLWLLNHRCGIERYQ
ncbi:hypothetical protein B0H21DRAFT_707282 [Amylocystis lapponica]|nr:hypothetical protein B0H21DRAFT_707282 [Amylocystis lapponica]